MQIPQSCELLATGPLAHLTTINPDGSPEVTVVWVGIDNDEFVIRHLGMWKKAQNIRRDPQSALPPAHHPPINYWTRILYACWSTRHKPKRPRSPGRWH
jgi:hypothetical protein